MADSRSAYGPEIDPQLESLIDPKALESLPKNIRPKVLEIVRRTVAFQASVSQFTSPIPPPDVLGQYEQILPGSADRILKMAEGQSDHRKQLEDFVIKSQISQSNVGQWMALGISIIAIGASVWVTLAGWPWVGGTLGGATVVSLAGTFIAGKWQQKKDLDQKRLGTQHRKHTIGK